jgi:hypothetical protein
VIREHPCGVGSLNPSQGGIAGRFGNRRGPASCIVAWGCAAARPRVRRHKHNRRAGGRAILLGVAVHQPTRTQFSIEARSSCEGNRREGVPNGGERSRGQVRCCLLLFAVVFCRLLSCAAIRHSARPGREIMPGQLGSCGAVRTRPAWLRENIPYPLTGFDLKFPRSPCQSDFRAFAA